MWVGIRSGEGLVGTGKFSRGWGRWLGLGIFWKGWEVRDRGDFYFF